MKGKLARVIGLGTYLFPEASDNQTPAKLLRVMELLVVLENKGMDTFYTVYSQRHKMKGLVNQMNVEIL